MTQAVSTHLGESLGTDFFSVREQFTEEQWSHFITVRRFVDEEVVPVIGPYWERAEICWPLIRRLPELGIVGEDIKGYGCAGMSPMACGLVTMELHRGDGSLGVVLGVHAGPGHAVDRDVRLGGAEGALAAGHGADGQARRLRPHRARPRLGLDRARNLGPPRRGRLGAERRQALDRPGNRGRPDRRLGPQHRGRAGQRVRGGEGITGPAGQRDRGEGIAAIGVAGRHHAGQRPGAGREPAARRAFVPGHQQGPGHHPQHLRLGGTGPRHLRLRHRPAVRGAAAAVRPAAGQFPDHPAAPGVHAGRPDRDAAVLPADRAPRRGRPADPHRGRAGQDAQHP